MTNSQAIIYFPATSPTTPKILFSGNTKFIIVLIYWDSCKTLYDLPRLQRSLHPLGAATTDNFLSCWVLFSVSISLCSGQGSGQGAGYEKAEAEGVETELCPKGKAADKVGLFPIKGSGQGHTGENCGQGHTPGKCCPYCENTDTNA